MAKNDITGDELVTKTTTEQYRRGWDAIDWSKKATPAIDIERMKQALASKGIAIPEGLSREELRAFILKHAD